MCLWHWLVLEMHHGVQEAQGVQHSKAQIRCENLTLLQAQLEHEQIEQAQREKIESLKSHLAAVIERTTRIRNAYEKEKKHLTGQVCCPTRRVRCALPAGTPTAECTSAACWPICSSLPPISTRQPADEGSEGPMSQS